LIHIKEMAMGQKINIRWELDNRMSELTIFPMTIFVPAENALKYAITAHADTPVVIRVKGQEEMVVVEIENTVNPDALGKGNGLGMGLENLRKQLEILTDADFSLDISEKGGRFGVVIRFPEARYAQ